MKLTLILMPALVVVATAAHTVGEGAKSANVVTRQAMTLQPSPILSINAPIVIGSLTTA
jgi:hypothetical protein